MRDAGIAIGVILFLTGIVGLVRPHWLRLQNRWWAAGILMVGTVLVGISEDPADRAAREQAAAEERATEELDEQRKDARPQPVAPAADEQERARKAAREVDTCTEIWNRIESADRRGDRDEEAYLKREARDAECYMRP